MKLKTAFARIVREGRDGALRLARGAAVLLGCVLLAAAVAAPAMAGETRNVVLIVFDGVRWQEVFTGADPALLNEDAGGIWASEEELKRRFWNDDPQERRKLLLPFLWNTIATQGQVFGNKTLGSRAHVTNPYHFSYPGYNEMATGFADPRIDSNKYGPNPNVSVFEWLNARPGFTGKVAVFGNWPAYKDIFNTPRSHLYIQADASLPPAAGKDTPRQALLRRLYETTTLLDSGVVPDSFTQVTLLDYVRSAHPRVLFVGYGDTDDWAHSGRYDNVLESAHHADGFVGELWQAMQSMPQYRGKTTFIVTTDHGRGSGLTEWKEHGVEQKGSDDVWIGVLGPDTPALGERRDIAPVTQAQIAATLAAVLGSDFRAAAPRAAAPLTDVLGPARAAAAAH
jgi:hypothetical protein